MRKPRAHADLIKAWADGAEIEFLSQVDGSWQAIATPTWFPDYSYRIKPQTIRYRLALMRPGHLSPIQQSIDDPCHVLSANNEAHANALQASKYFVRWLTDWETVTLEDQ